MPHGLTTKWTDRPRRRCDGVPPFAGVRVGEFFDCARLAIPATRLKITVGALPRRYGPKFLAAVSSHA